MNCFKNSSYGVRKSRSRDRDHQETMQLFGEDLAEKRQKWSDCRYFLR